MTSPKISPCPFCGEQKEFLVEQLDRDASVVICQGITGEHSACLARGPVGVCDDELEDQPGYAAAIREWNARAAIKLPAGPTVLPTGDVQAVAVANAIHNTIRECRKAIEAAGGRVEP